MNCLGHLKDNPTSGPPLDKQRQSEVTPRSVVVPEPPKVGYRDPAQPQLSLDEVMDFYEPNKQCPRRRAWCLWLQPLQLHHPSKFTILPLKMYPAH